MNFRKINNLVGWITFVIATTVYFMTMEPTVSFWDCGEFISCAYKVEVGHSPGAPLFMMIQRMFGILAGGNLQKVAMMTNAWSALASSLTILFLFWTITHFAKRLLAKGEENPDSSKTALIMGAGLVGALAYTFSDTFWFSAVEGEVYATSSVFSAIVFWAILKWEHAADTKYADRWLLFIAYMIGLSVGVHLLSLLGIPAITMVYYYRRYKPTTSGAIVAFLVGGILLGLVQYGVLQGIPIFASKFDLLFVNSFGLPFDSGAITFIILLVALLVWGLSFAKRRGNYTVHTAILCLTFIVIGFSSYLAPIIRSRADVPIDMTNPDNAISLTSYIQREQFGQQPLAYGQDFTARPIAYPVKGYQYARSEKNGKDHYEIVGKKLEQEFAPEDKRFFPRIHDNNDASHIRFYRDFLGLAEGEQPTSADNLSYFYNIQLNWMWWRYFMWNYAGRQNDMQGHAYNAKDGNWISGIGFIDKARGLGDLDKMQDGYRNNPARNQLYFLPFILGLLGLVYQFNNKKEDGIVTLVLFFFTGIAIAIFLNMPPLQPRERDYAYAATYAYAIWIGLGVLMVNDLFQRFLKGTKGIYAAILLCLLAVPTLMASEEWDDHDRSKKTIARATAWNVLQSCAPNAILFTYGDNDTYPVWYLQEVEGIRRDVRVINMSLLGIDWYIDQLNYKINDADAIPMLWKKEHYIGDKRNYIRYYQSPQVPQDRYFNLVDICNFMLSEDPTNMLQSMGMDEKENFYPTKNFFIKGLSKDEIAKNGMLTGGDTTAINNEIKFSFPKDVAYKDDIATLMIVAAIAQEGWKRPIYFGAGLPSENYIGLHDYMRLEGSVFRLMPYKANNPPMTMQGEMGTVDVEKSYDLYMNKYQWGNAGRNDVYFDEKNRIMLSSYRINAGRIAAELVNRGKNAEAIKVLNKVYDNISEHSYFYDATGYYLAVAYYRAGDKAKGKIIAEKLARNAEDDINYILTLSDDRKEALFDDIRRDVSIIDIMSSTAMSAGDAATADMFKKKVEMLSAKITQNMNVQGMQQ